MKQIGPTIDDLRCMPMSMLMAAVAKRLRCRGWSEEQSYAEQETIARLAVGRIDAIIKEAVEDITNLAVFMYVGEPPPESVMMMVTGLAVFALRGIEIADQISAERSN